MKRVKSKKRGFTLVELIIVIAIIGVLAAVLIPTFSGVIDKANTASDLSDVKNMNTVLALEATMQDKAYFATASEVSAILKNEGFDLVPKSKSKTYWYDRDTNKVVLASNAEVFTARLGASAGMVAYADGESQTSFTQDSLEALSSFNPNLLYVDANTKNSLTVALNTVYTLVEKAKAVARDASYDAITDKMAEIFTESIVNAKLTISGVEQESSVASVKSYLAQYTPYNNIYVAEDDFYITNGSKTQVFEVFSYQFTPGLPAIPTPSSVVANKTVTIANNTLIIPASVTAIGYDAFTKLSGTTNVVIDDSSLLNEDNINPAAYVGNVASSQAEYVTATIIYQQAEKRWGLENVGYGISIYDRGQITALNGLTKDETSGVYTTGSIASVDLTSLDGLTFKYTNEQSQTMKNTITLTGSTYNITHEIARYLIPTVQVNVQALVAQQEELGNIRLSCRKYGDLVVFSGAVSTKDGSKIYRIKPFGYFTNVTFFVERKIDEKHVFYQVRFRDPLQGQVLAGMEGVTYKLYTNEGLWYTYTSDDLSADGYVAKEASKELSLNEGLIFKDTVTKIEAYVGEKLIFVQNY